MKTLIILAALIATPVLAEVEFTLIPDRIEAAATEKAAEQAKKERAEADAARAADSQEFEDMWSSSAARQQDDNNMNSIRNMKGKVDKEVVDGRTNRQASEDMNSSRSNRRGVSHNTSRSNTRPSRLDTDDDGDSLPTTDRRCNAKDNDCNDSVIDSVTNSENK